MIMDECVQIITLEPFKSLVLKELMQRFAPHQIPITFRFFLHIIIQEWSYQDINNSRITWYLICPIKPSVNVSLFFCFFENNVDLDQLTSDEASLSESTLLLSILITKKFKISKINFNHKTCSMPTKYSHFQFCFNGQMDLSRQAE